MTGDADLPLPPHGKPPSVAADDMPCNRCQMPTPRSVLNHLGGRCSGCYEAYCREPQPPFKPRAPTGRLP